MTAAQQSTESADVREPRCTHWRIGHLVGLPRLIDVQCTLAAGHSTKHLNGPEVWGDGAGEHRTPPDQTPPGTRVTCPDGTPCSTYRDCAASGCRQVSDNPTPPGQTNPGGDA